MLLLAVHISDGILQPPWWLGGFALAGVLLVWGSWRVSDEEVPRIALLAAAFFVASTIHIKMPPTSVHLLLNGLVGVLLGPRAVLAILVGLLLQAALLNHGGFTTLGINVCVMTLPALAASFAYRAIARLGEPRGVSSWGQPPPRGWICSCLVFVACSFVLWSGLLSLLMVHDLLTTSADWQTAIASAWDFTTQPWLAASVLSLALPFTWLERRVNPEPHFAVGLCLGSLTVLATSGLNCLVLLAGGEHVWPVAPWAMVVAHLPIAVIEGLTLGVTLRFLSRVKPELMAGDAS